MALQLHLIGLEKEKVVLEFQEQKAEGQNQRIPIAFVKKVLPAHLHKNRVQHHHLHPVRAIEFVKLNPLHPALHQVQAAVLPVHGDPVQVPVPAAEVQVVVAVGLANKSTLCWRIS